MRETDECIIPAIVSKNSAVLVTHNEITWY